MLLHGCSLLPQDKLQAFQRQLVLSSEIRQQRGRPALIGAQLCDQELQLLAGHLVQRLRARCRHRLLLAPLCLKRLHTRRRPGELLLRRGRQGLRFARPLRQGTRLAHPLLEQLLHLPPHGGHLRRRLVALAPRPFPHVPQHRLRTLQLCLQPLLPVQRPPLLPRRRTRCSGLRSPRVPRLLLGGGGVRVRVCRWLSPGVRGSCLHRRVACRVSPLLHRDAQRVDAGGNLFAQRSIAFGALPSGLLNHPLHTLQLCADVRHNVRTQLFQVRCRPHRLPQPCDLLAQRSVARRLLRRRRHSRLRDRLTHPLHKRVAVEAATTRLCRLLRRLQKPGGNPQLCLHGRHNAALPRRHRLPDAPHHLCPQVAVLHLRRARGRGRSLCRLRPTHRRHRRRRL
eukprot:Rhum_TRINITY_DN13025_c0_g1::Rhum_TRINITY_DN13025_c0_g1_i6::g.56357::m.56357